MPAAPKIVVAGRLPDLVSAATAHLRAVSADAVVARGRFRIALAGGSTPRAVYPALAKALDWTHAEVFFGDERAVPPTDPQSNYGMARETLLEPAGVPAANVHRWHSEAADLDAAARDYEAALTAGGEPPWLDLALLGLGPDGHTASLFPKTAALDETKRLAVAVDAPNYGRRLTLTYPALLGARDVSFLVTGLEKATVLASVLRDEHERLPATRIMRRAGAVTVFCDRAAASALSERDLA